MQVVHDLRQVFLGLVLTGHVGKFNAVGGFDVNLGVAFAHVEHHGVGAAVGPLRQLFGHQLADADEDHQGQNPVQQDGQQGGRLFNDFAGEYRPGLVEPLGPSRIVHQAGFEDFGALLVGEDDLVGLDVHLADVSLLGHGHKGAVVHLLDLPLQDPGHHQPVEQHHHQQDNEIIGDDGFFWFFDLVHNVLPFQKSLR